jgi:hypothetical protein
MPYPNYSAQCLLCGTSRARTQKKPRPSSESAPQTVKTRLHRARHLLRDVLGEEVRANLKDVFPFERPRCDRLVGRLLNQLGLPNNIT